jgi:hypothetical protein
VTSYRFVSALLATVLLCVGAAQPDAQALDAKAVKKAVEQYVDAETTDAKRASLLETLGKAKNADIASGLKSHIRKETARAHALELALALHVRGQFAAFDKFFDEHPQEITQLGLITADKGAARALQKRWAAAEIESETFGILNEAFLQYGVDMEALAEFQKILVDEAAPEERRAEAGKVLQFQFGLTTDDATEISLRWDALKKEFKDHGERPPLAGMDLLAQSGWELQSARRFGSNLSLGSEGERFGLIRRAEGFPPSVKSYGYTVSVRARLDASYKGDAGFLIVVDGKTTIIGVTVDNGVWSAPGRSDSVKVPIKAGDWSTVSLTITPATEAGKMNILCSVDGQSLVGVGAVAGPPVGYCIQCMAGSGTWGSLDYTRN